MAFEQKNNTGATFPLTDEDKKFYAEKEWTAPVHKGTCTVDGKKYWVSVYKNKGKESGKDFLGYTFKEMEQQSVQKTNGEVNNTGDDLPF